MTIAADLFALQETDLALDKALARLAEIEELTGETEELMATREALEAATKAVHELQSKQKDLEFEVEEVRTHAGQVEQKLYGGRVTNPKELQDLDADLRSLKNQTKTREDVLLTHLVELDEAEGVLREAQAAYDAAEAAWRADQGHLHEEKSQLEPEVARLQGVKEQQVAGIERAALSLYGLLRERRAGVAVAGVERGMCQGCRITLPTGVIQKARMPGLVQCVSCERILVFT
jgi:predicted  nucleic acid-binding Zn-ribbon protein